SQENHARVYSFEYGFRGDRAMRYLHHWGYAFPTDGAPGFEVTGYRATLYPTVFGSWALEGSYMPDMLGLYPDGLGALTMRVIDLQETPAFIRYLRLGAVGRVVALHRLGFETLPIRAVVRTFLLEPTLVMDVPGALPR